jgi:CubicO group peptidase (beta-lactamase class C family)
MDIGRDALPSAVQHFERGVFRGRHAGAQLYVSLHGQTVADVAMGENRPGEPMTTDLLLPWLSATKPLTALAVARLWEDGRLDLDDPVCLHVPEFGRAGKERITLRHLLGHSGGFRTTGIGGPQFSREENLARLCAAPLEPGWVPGERVAYQTASSWYILSEVVERLTGRPTGEHLRDTVLRPLGMVGKDEAWAGIPAERYEELRGRLGVMYRTDVTRGAAPPPEEEEGTGSGSRSGSMAQSMRPYPWNEKRWATRDSPAENGWGPARALGRLYEGLLDIVQGERRGEWPDVVRPETLAVLTAPEHPEGRLDESLDQVVHWGLGFRINGRTAGGLPSAASEMGRQAAFGSFGHGGHRSSMAFADPRHGLVMAVIANGLPSAPAHQRRIARGAQAVYADLGLGRRRR